MQVINNIWCNIFYTCTFVDFITSGKIVGSFSTNGSTATFIAGVSTNFWHRSAYVASSVFQYCGSQMDGSKFCWPSCISEFLILSFMTCGQTVPLFAVEHEARLIRHNMLQPTAPEIFINQCKLRVWGIVVTDRLADDEYASLVNRPN